MKPVAVFLILNILLLSSFMGMANVHHEKAPCCTSEKQKDWNKQQQHTSKNDCAKGACNSVRSCGTCGFMVTSSVSIAPIISVLKSQTLGPIDIGELSDYHSKAWNPPKV